MKWPALKVPGLTIKHKTMLYVLSIINAVIFVAIAALHIYWAFGGRKWADAVLPEMPHSAKKLFVPGKVATLAVAACLLFFAFIALGAFSLFGSFLSNNFFVYGNAAVGTIFLLRAIGDFKYAGMFKKIKGTVFAKNDATYFTPLCIAISLIAFLTAYILYTA
jgi:Protein of unknown function (DUF3995)